MNDLNIREQVRLGNIQIVEKGLVIQSFGNVSARARSGVLVIKPSGLDPRASRPEDMVEVDIHSGKVGASQLPPSSIELYRAFDQIGAVVHTHSRHATAWAQACRPVPCLGTTHADFFQGDIPVTRSLTAEEVGSDYERETGRVIVECLGEMNVDPLSVPGILVAHHGPFIWGRDIEEAVRNAEAVEYVAELASLTLSISPQCKGTPARLLQKHFSRKHGPGAYYGQRS